MSAWTIKSWEHPCLARHRVEAIIQEIDGELKLARFSGRCGQFIFIGRDIELGDFEEAKFDRKTREITVAIRLPRPDGEIGKVLQAVQNPGLLFHYAQTENEMIKIVLMHEISHQIHAYIDTYGIMLSEEKPKFDPVWKEWKRVYGLKQFITDWAAKTEDRNQGSMLAEYFAEMFVARHLFSDVLRERDPDGHALIDQAIAAF